MYSTCLFCHRALGANDVIEHFPVGRKLAFDTARGRLWVVCTGCGQWNLTPVEERWEAVEECERTFRVARRRVSTDQIGLARVAERYDLIRIGAPLRPEFAAWRYAERFRRRQMRSFAAAGIVGVGMIGAGTLGVSLSWLAMPALAAMHNLLNRRTELGEAQRAIRRLYERQTGVKPSTNKELKVKLIAFSPQEWGLRIAGMGQPVDVRGPEVVHLAHLVLPVTNPGGASRAQVNGAVREIEGVGDPERYFIRAIQYARTKGKLDRSIHTWRPEIRLAVEMAAHEEAERRAMHGELELLAKAWREAEEIAAISDDMFLPRSITETLARLRGRRENEPKNTPEESS